MIGVSTITCPNRGHESAAEFIEVESREDVAQFLHCHAPRTDLGFIRDRHLTLRKSATADLRWGIQ